MGRSNILPPELEPRPAILEELEKKRKRWTAQFNAAIALMSIIPLLICCYLITVRFFSLSILAGINGVYFLAAVLFALIGLLAGRVLIRHVIDELVDANHRLAELQESQVQFINQVSHELRTPVAIVKGALDNLKDGLHGPLTQDQQEPIEIGQRELVRLNRVIGDLLDLGQIESGKFRLKRQTFVLQELIRETAERCQGLAEARGLQLDLALPECAVRILGDRDRLAQVLINLQNNAIKFTNHGSIRITLQQDGQLCRVFVTDSGPGIAKEALERIFDKFERVGDGNKEGSGLGLPIAKALVELHGGRLWAESELGQGSRLIMELPVLQDEGDPASVESVQIKKETRRRPG